MSSDRLRVIRLSTPARIFDVSIHVHRLTDKRAHALAGSSLLARHLPMRRHIDETPLCRLWRES